MSKISILFFCLTISILLVMSCQENTVITDGTKVPVDTPNETTVIVQPMENVENVQVFPTQPVRVLFKIRAEFPSGSVTPDLVSMDGMVISENTVVSQGMHTFVIEKRGYLPKTETIMVNDKENDGIFEINVLLETKQRIVVFDIRDASTNDVIVPDQVTIVRIPEGEQQTLSNQSYIKPGPKKIVINKQGYNHVSQDIIVPPDEEPYIISFSMTPQ